MASSMGDILKYGLLAGGAYLVYQAYQSTVAPAAAGTTPAAGTPAGTTPAAGTPTYVYVPPTPAQALAASAVGNAYLVNGQMTADQWSYLWTNALAKPPLDVGLFSTLFFPNGRPSDPAKSPMMTAATFVDAIAAKGISGAYGVAGLKGLSGPGRAAMLPLPLFIIRGKGYASSPYFRRVG